MLIKDLYLVVFVTMILRIMSITMLIK